MHMTLLCPRLGRSRPIKTSPTSYGQSRKPRRLASARISVAVPPDRPTNSPTESMTSFTNSPSGSWTVSQGTNSGFFLLMLHLPVQRTTTRLRQNTASVNQLDLLVKMNEPTVHHPYDNSTSLVVKKSHSGRQLTLTDSPPTTF